MYYLKTLFNFIIKGFICIATFFAPTFHMILGIGFMVIADFCVAIIAANKNNIPITSKKMRPTIGKFIAYGAGILVAHVIERLFLNDFPAMKLVSAFIAYIELKSINEGIEKIIGVNIFKAVLEKFNLNGKL